jgi:8-amino-7-oxononanoate synthase
VSDLSHAMRFKRFGVKPDPELEFRFETLTGSKFKLQLRNCSLTGLEGFCDQPEGREETWEVGALIPAAKISWPGHEIALGRLVLRRVTEQENGVVLAFSTIDSKIPLDGHLSKFLAEGAVADKVYQQELSPDKFHLGNFVEIDSRSSDLFQKVHQFAAFQREWVDAAKFNYGTIRVASKGERVQLRRKRKGGRHDYISMGSNDYLGLSTDPEVLEAAKQAIDVYGFGSTGSPVSTGQTDLHEELTDLLAKTFRKEKALLFNSGYAANVGIIPGLTRANDLVVADALSHASIQDALLMSRATSRFFKHNDIHHLEKVLHENRDSHAGSLLVTEGVFSMDGDVPPLDLISRTARKHNCRLMVDEAHSFGVIGPTGLGAWEKFPDSKVDVIMGTFSKICGGIGGFVAADREVVDWLFAMSRAHVFSVSIPPSTAAAALTALKVFLRKPELLRNLRSNIQHFLGGLRDMGYPVQPGHESAVIPLVIRDEKKLGVMNQVFQEEGVHVIPVVYPAVGRNNCRFRFTVMATHSVSDLDYVLSVIEKAALKAGLDVSQLGQAHPVQEPKKAA